MRGRSVSNQFLSPIPCPVPSTPRWDEVGISDIESVVGRRAFLLKRHAAVAAPCRSEFPLARRGVHPSGRSSRSRCAYPSQGRCATLIRLLPGWSDVGKRIEAEPFWKGPGKRLGPVNLQPQSLGCEKAHVAAPPGHQGGQRSPNAYRLGKARVAITK